MSRVSIMTTLMVTKNKGNPCHKPPGVWFQHSDSTPRIPHDYDCCSAHLTYVRVRHGSWRLMLIYIARIWLLLCASKTCSSSSSFPRVATRDQFHGTICRPCYHSMVSLLSTLPLSHIRVCCCCCCFNSE